MVTRSLRQFRARLAAFAQAFLAVRFLAIGCLAAGSVCAADKALGGELSRTSSEFIAQGRELFTREWTHDRRARVADGLGPMYNDISMKPDHLRLLNTTAQG